MVLTISTDQASLSHRSARNNDNGMRALNSPTLKKSRDTNVQGTVQHKENVDNMNNANAEDQITDELEGNSEAAMDRVLGNYSNSRSHKSTRNYETDANAEIEKKTVIKSTTVYEAPVSDNGPSGTYTSPVPLIKKKPEAVSISKRVAEFANKPNLKFAFENAMFSNKSKQSEMADRLEREERENEREKEREREERQRERNYSFITTPKKSMPLPTDRYSKEPSPVRFEAQLSAKKPDKQSKKPSAAVHKPPPRRSSKELIIDRTDYGNKQSSMFSRRKSSTTSTSASSVREEDEKIERYSEPIPSFFRSPMRRLSKDKNDFLNNPKSRGFSPGNMASGLGFNQLSINKSPMKRLGLNPFYTPKNANGQQCL
jgi:hypothetical protein